MMCSKAWCCCWFERANCTSGRKIDAARLHCSVSTTVRQKHLSHGELEGIAVSETATGSASQQLAVYKQPSWLMSQSRIQAATSFVGVKGNTLHRGY